ERRFRSDPSLVGKTLKLNGKPFTVIGITPKDFIGTYPNAPSVWLPVSAFRLLEAARDPLHNTTDRCCEMFGRLKNNVSKQLAQSAARRKEIGMRLALGASRGRLIQQLLTEASLLAVMAGGAGLVASWFAERFLENSVAAALPPMWGFLAINVNPDIRVFGYT